MGTLDIGVIGGGTVSHNHASALEELDHEIIAIADIDPETRRSYADRYGVPAQYEEYERMLDEEPLDAVLVAVPNALHADCAVAALERDVYPLVEKPIARTLAGAERIRRAEADSDAMTMVGFKKAFEASTEIMTDAIDAGELSEVYEVNVEMVRRRGIPRIGSWFTREDVSGGGAVVDIGPHMLHLALYALGFPDVEKISATAGDHFGSDPDYTYLNMWGGDPTEDRTFDVEDHARALIRTAGEADIHVNLTWASNREPVQRVQVLGEDAGLSFDPSESEVTMHSTQFDALTETQFQRSANDPFRRQWEYLGEVIAGDREHEINTVDQGVAVQRLIEGLYESVECEREVDAAELGPQATADD